MANRITLTVGLPASGKSWWADQQVIDGQGNVVQINRDSLREMLYGACREPAYTFSKGREEVVRHIQVQIANAAVSNKKNIIISDTNLDPNRVDLWREWAKNNKYEIHFKSFLDVPLKTLLERDAVRANGVGKDAIMRMWEQYIVPTFPQEECKQYIPNNDLPPAFVVDIDGTLANMAGKRGPFEWNKVGLDEPYRDVISLVLTLHHAGYKIVVMSGRDGCCWEATRQWLDDNGVPFSELIMREAGDTRKDSIIKEELFWKEVAPKFKVVGVLDDRAQVVQKWRDMGLRCYAVQEGNF